MVEPKKVTDVYVSQANRIANKVQDDELADELEVSYTELHFGKKNREFDQMANDLIDKVKQQEIEAEGDEQEQAGSDDSEVSDDGKDLKKMQPTTEGLSDEYKLFEVITSAFPKQVLRYVAPSSKQALEPLWTSDKRKLTPADIPKCQHCGGQRQLEVQITPQLFDFMSPLHYVDWETICIYTCVNHGKCLPDFGKNEYFLQEHAYIQFSLDFEKVKYGTPEEIQRFKSQQQAEEVYVQTEEEKADAEEKARKKAEKNKKQRERKKEKAKQQKESHEQIQK